MKDEFKFTALFIMLFAVIAAVLFTLVYYFPRDRCDRCGHVFKHADYVELKFGGHRCMVLCDYCSAAMYEVMMDLIAKERLLKK